MLGRYHLPWVSHLVLFSPSCAIQGLNSSSAHFLSSGHQSYSNEFICYKASVRKTSPLYLCSSWNKPYHLMFGLLITGSYSRAQLKYFIHHEICSQPTFSRGNWSFHILGIHWAANVFIIDLETFLYYRFTRWLQLSGYKSFKGRKYAFLPLHHCTWHCGCKIGIHLSNELIALLMIAIWGFELDMSAKSNSVSNTIFLNKFLKPKLLHS